MNMRRWVGAIVLALATVASGCGGEGTGPDDGGRDASADGTVGPRCGDGVQQGNDEVCDDGNTVSGDGCSADCRSDETCGNSIVDTAAGEMCDDGNTVDGDACRGDCGSNYRCGNGVVDLVEHGASEDEVCDDGNTVNGDGCNATCDSDETCGNGIVDVGAGEVCDDGNTEDGDECSSDCTMSMLCGNGELDGAEECDDDNTESGDGCSANCLIERCGNGRVDVGEVCDDGNSDDTDGCTAACEFTCDADADCDDANPCTGTETCANPGTEASRCVAGEPPPDGEVCGTGRVCRGGICADESCGDGEVTASEQCDDGNTVAGDGCESDCTWTCTSDGDCSDGNECNGVETCTDPSSYASRCVAGAPPTEGTVCDRDANPATRDICRTGMCFASTCGDGYTDGGATPAEQCDDGNTMPGDGCSPTCELEAPPAPTAFRVTSLELISPRITIDLSILGCFDATETPLPLVSFSVNSALEEALRPTMPASGPAGSYSLHIVDVFRPLNPTAATTAIELHLNAACMEAPTPDSCGPDATPEIMTATANNRSTGTCFMPDPADVNSRAGTPTAYTPTVNTVSGPCFITDEQSLTITLTVMGELLAIPLERARVAGTYSGTPPNRIVTGVVTGFLSETAAADILLPAGLPLIGGNPLYQHLQAGDRSAMNSDGHLIPDGCNVSGGAHEDDADTVTNDAGETVRGFWFFLNVEAELVDWTGA